MVLLFGNLQHRRRKLQALRKRWEDICNRHLELAGSNARIDMRSYKDRGINLQSEQHQGAKKWAEEIKEKILTRKAGSKINVCYTKRL